jgi:hypothetical protein
MQADEERGRIRERRIWKKRKAEGNQKRVRDHKQATVNMIGGRIVNLETYICGLITDHMDPVIRVTSFSRFY